MMKKRRQEADGVKKQVANYLATASHLGRRQ